MKQNMEQDDEFTGLERELWDIAKKTVAEYKERPKRISESEEEQIAELRAQVIEMPESEPQKYIAIPTYRAYGMAKGYTIVKITSDNRHR